MVLAPSFCLCFPVFLCGLFSCILSFCSSKQPLYLHILTTLNPAKEHLSVPSVSSSTLFQCVCCSLALIASGVAGIHQIAQTRRPIPPLKHSIWEWGWVFSPLTKIEGCCLKSGNRCWRVKQHTSWLYTRALTAQWFTKIRFPICTILFKSFSKHTRLTLREHSVYNVEAMKICRSHMICWGWQSCGKSGTRSWCPDDRSCCCTCIVHCAGC